MKRNLRSISMKFRLIMLASILSVTYCKAQIDITAIQSSPTNGQTITGGKPFSVGLAIKNNSTTAISGSDVFIITCYVDKGSGKKDTLACATFTGPFLPIAPGATAGPFSVSCTYNISTSVPNGATICQSVYMQGKTDPKPGDNVACAAVKLVAGSTGSGGHNTGTPQYSNFGNYTGQNAIPFNWAANDKVQWLFLASDFKNTSSAKAPSGTISKVYVRSNEASKTCNLSNVKIKLGQITEAEFSSNTFVTGLTEVFNAADYSVSTPGWIEFTLSKPFQYDNTKNLVVEATGRDGFNVSQNTSIKDRRIFGSSTASAGTKGDGLTEFGFDFNGTGITGMSAVPAILVYPNPAADKIHIEAPGDFHGTIKIYDLQGKNIIGQPISNGATIPVSELANGIYFYLITDNENVITETNKIVIAH